MAATSKMYGVKVRLPKDGKDPDTGSVKPDIWERVLTPMINTIFLNYREVGEGGHRPIRPRVRFRCDRDGLMLDLIVDMVQDVEAAQWNAERFNPQNFRDHLIQAANKAASNWGKSKFGRQVIADQETVKEEDIS